MAEIAVSFAIDKLLPLLTEEFNLLKGVHKEFADIKDELESIQAFLKDADRRAAAPNGDNNGEGVKTWVKQIREAAFQIEDIIDNYMMYAEQRHNFSHLFKTLKQRHKIASGIRDIKSLVRGIKERSERYGFQRSLDQGSSHSRGSQNVKLHPLREAALYIDEADVVGFEAPGKTLTDWMVNEREEHTVISVVGMGGQGKTTLVKKVFDNKDVIAHFDCRVWITVSQTYDVKEVLRDMLLKIYKQKDENPPQNINQMDQRSLTEELRNCLKTKRYVVVFDDVWSVNFWDHIKFALIDNKSGSKIFITTRNEEVLVSCKISSFTKVLHLQPLTQEQSLTLFNKRAFKFDYAGCCPEELVGIANEIVQKCKGLPLAIVAIGGLLSTKEKHVFEWQRFSENLSAELKKDTHLMGIKEVLALSYDDLPYYLKSCLLYFGMYPEDYQVNSNRVIRQWIGEGFVKEESGKTLEEVAEGYLTELIHRSLVQVSSIRTDGKAKGCRVHDLVREMILEKNEDLNFFKHISEDGHSSFSGRIHRLSITTISDDFVEHIGSSHVRSLLVIPDKESKTNFEFKIPKTFKLLRVLDCNSDSLMSFPENFGNFIHLKYLSFGFDEILKILKSIGMLRNLETLKIRSLTQLIELPKEISKLRKLRHLISKKLSLIQLEEGIGEMASLQTLHSVDLNTDGAAKIIKGLGKLNQMRDLRLVNVRREDGIILSSSINEMQHLERLYVKAIRSEDDYEVIDLDLISLPTKLRKLKLHGILQKLPEWIPKLQNLVELFLGHSRLTEDSLKSLNCLQHLLSLTFQMHSYEGLFLHFEDGWFQKLKTLNVIYCIKLRLVIIDKGALPSLKMLNLGILWNLENIPIGIQHLEKLEVLRIFFVSDEFVKNISTEDWNSMQHVPLVDISDRNRISN
ncbi:disease resistance protein RPM1-like isoform X3 [Trifolium pratense]|uniref:disease resistance protein RPM1-like isoform X2 n=1 Tax=Trifolium pratense TaxID=57577 RepID=UPI001E693A15|nr:disease resistance protein RPM1-like isoform X2 [Trifolium pratense]XP_045827053.1 disease resistance protein RPM1-like isoform X3 [Trifolium pratense]